MIDAAYLDPKVRNELFAESTATDDLRQCRRADVNNMGIKVLASEAIRIRRHRQNWKQTGDAGKGAARLEASTTSPVKLLPPGRPT